MQNTITYSTKLKFQSEEDKKKIIEFIKLEREIFNFSSRKHFGAPRNSIIDLHAKVYKSAKIEFPNAKSQLIIKAENNCLSAYQTAKTNKHHLTKPIIKTKLATSIDKRLYSFNGTTFRLTTLEKRIVVTPSIYDRLQYAILNYKMCDPTLYVKNNDVYIGMVFTFQVEEISHGKYALGIDVGIRRFAATSEGNIYKDKVFLKQKRKLRYLKRCLQSKNSKSSKRHLKKLSHKERNINHNFVHHLSNKLLQTQANTIVLEDLNVKKLKSKKHKYQNKNRISQFPLFLLRQFLTYKAALKGKRVVCVNPAYTSQTDCVSGKIDGERKGCRFYSKRGLIYDADINAAVNIAKLSKLPVSYTNILDGQAIVNQPIVNVFVYKPRSLDCGS